MSSFPHLIVHGTHHKMGTVWIATTLREVCEKLGLTLQEAPHGVEPRVVEPGTDIFFDGHSRFVPSELGAYRGSHMVRDLRDVVVSGYHYHLWTDEPWANIPLNERQRRRFQIDVDGPEITYKELLNSVDKPAGVMIEMRRLGPLCDQLNAWDFDDEHILEVHFEDLMADGERHFPELFRWWGFSDKQAETATQVAMSRHVSKIKQRGLDVPHIRSGGSGEWSEVFDADHLAQAKSQFGELLIRMGYESDTDW